MARSVRVAGDFDLKLEHCVACNHEWVRMNPNVDKAQRGFSIGVRLVCSLRGKLPLESGVPKEDKTVLPGRLLPVTLRT